jgi:hypothetical protein
MRNGRWRPKALKPYGQAENKGGDVRTDAVMRDTIGTQSGHFCPDYFYFLQIGTI